MVALFVTDVVITGPDAFSFCVAVSYQGAPVVLLISKRSYAVAFLVHVARVYLNLLGSFLAVNVAAAVEVILILNQDNMKRRVLL